MVIMKKCSKCLQKYEYGKQCSCYFKNKKIQNAIKGIEDSFYNTPAWRTLRKIKLIEYNGACQRCLVKYGIINTKNPEGHHLKPRSKYPELELEPDNIVILCKTCNLQLGDSGITDWDRTKEIRNETKYVL